MTVLRTTAGYEADMEALVEGFPDEVSLIDALTDELEGRGDVLEMLTYRTPKWVSDLSAPFEVKEYRDAWKKDLCIYILKMFDEEGHRLNLRVFVGHDVKKDVLFLLSCQPRATSYAQDSDAHRELCQRYEQLSIPPAWRR